MKYRVWCSDIDVWTDREAIDADSSAEAAREFVSELDSQDCAFPDDNDGDLCHVSVCRWDDADDDADEEPGTSSLRSGS